MSHHAFGPDAYVVQQVAEAVAPHIGRVRELEAAIRHALYELTENGSVDPEDHDTDPLYILSNALKGTTE